MSRLTPSSIWNIFLASGKRHLLLTGGRGIGKTTALCALPLPVGTPCIRSALVPGKGVWLAGPWGKLQIQIGAMGQASAALPQQRMKPFESGLCKAAGIVRQAAAAQSEFVLLDEIGFLESGSECYAAALDTLFAQKRVAAAVRKQELPFLQRQLSRPDALVLDLDAPAAQMGCVIMASGLGRRFGGSKLLAEFCARPLLHYTLQATSGLFADRVMVTRSAEAARFAQSCGVRTALHTLPARSDAVRLGVQALKPGLAGAVFCPADQPCLSPETLLALAAAAQSVPECLWRTAFGGQVGAPAAFSRTFFAELCCLPAGQGGGAVLKAHPQLVRCVQAQRAEELLDIDTKEDLETLQRRILKCSAD